MSVLEDFAFRHSALKSRETLTEMPAPCCGDLWALPTEKLLSEHGVCLPDIKCLSFSSAETY